MSEWAPPQSNYCSNHQPPVPQSAACPATSLHELCQTPYKYVRSGIVAIKGVFYRVCQLFLQWTEEKNSAHLCGYLIAWSLRPASCAFAHCSQGDMGVSREPNYSRGIRQKLYKWAREKVRSTGPNSLFNKSCRNWAH